MRRSYVNNCKTHFPGSIDKARQIWYHSHRRADVVAALSRASFRANEIILDIDRNQRGITRIATVFKSF
jgi:hypothetical protein